MKSGTKKSLKLYFLEFVIYAALVTVYFFLVLHLLGDWLFHLYHDERTTYAWVALGLIVGQGIVLDAATRVLLRLAPRIEGD
jgi:hypothetical protein